MRHGSRIPTVHYAWVVAGTAMLVVVGALGLARFAFGMVLPAMAADLGLDYREQGLLGTSYFVGYLAIVVVMPWLAPKLGPRRLCSGGLAIVTAGLLGMVLGRDYGLLSGSYFVVGLGSGAAFVGAMALPSFWFHPSHRARGAGVATAGAGVGILISGLMVPQVPAAFSFAPWQVIWLIFALVISVFCLLAAALLRDRPQELGLTPYGRARASPPRTRETTAHANAPRNWPFLLHLGSIYALFGASALTYTTFIVTTMIDTLAVTPATAGLLWAGVGGLSIFSGGIFGNVSDRFGHRAGMLSALGIQGIAYALVAAGTGMPGLYVSIALFGLSAWSMPTIVAAATGDYLGAEKAAAGFAILTFMFALGQVAGPAGAGLLADVSGGFALSYGVAAGLNGLAALLCVFLRPPAGFTPDG